jgi:AraC-like DNA-binding protein
LTLNLISKPIENERFILYFGMFSNLRQNMIFKHLLPSTQLQPFVKKYLLLHFKVDDPNANFSKAYPPCPEQCITFNPKSKLKAINLQTGEIVHRTANYLSGQQASRLNLFISNDYLMVKVVFHPGAMYRLFGVPMNLIADQYIDTQSVIGKEINEVNEKMANATTYESVINIAEEYLCGKVRKMRIDENPVGVIGKLLLKNPFGFSLDWLAKEASWSPRQLERQFIERIGVSPKFFAKISRFDHAFQMKQQFLNLDWLTIAVQNGYSDYQHMVKDFKEFAGETPNILLNSESQAPERILGLVYRGIETR